MKPPKIFFISLTLLFTPCFAKAGVPPPLEDAAIAEIDREYAGQLDALSKKGGALGDFFKLKRADQAISKHDAATARKLANDVHEDFLEFWKNIVLSEADLLESKPGDVLGRLGSLPKRPDIALSIDETAYQNLFRRALIVRYRAKKAVSRPASDDAAELLALFPAQDEIRLALGTDATVALNLEQKISQLHILNYKYQYKKVPGVVSVSEILAGNLDNEKKCQALSELGNSLKQVNGMAQEASNAFDAVVEQNCGDAFVPRALYWSGVLAGGVDSDRGEATLLRLARDYSSHRLADDALYKLYKRAEKKNNVADEETYYKKLLAFHTGDMRNSLVFERGFPLYQKGEFKAAAEYFKKIADSSPTKDESYPQGLYWYARTLERMDAKKNKNTAHQLYERIVQQFPFSFYAVLAGKRINKGSDVPPLPIIGGSAPSGSGDIFALIDSLNAAGFHDAASEVLDFALNLNPEWVESNTEFVAKKLIESQHYRKALDLAATKFDATVYGMVYPSGDGLFAAFYPPAFRAQTAAAYRNTHLPKGAIEGIMREESLFQKNVRSWVGATGLMQLMPATAAMVARNSGGDSADLTNPQTNIHLGAFYLRNMIDKFDGQLPLAIMAYNAGPGNVLKWLRINGNLELDEFIETVPFDETRGYVKRVMRSMHVYGDYYGEPYFVRNAFSFRIKK